jgi:hypothetical protein
MDQVYVFFLGRLDGATASAALSFLLHEVAVSKSGALVSVLRCIACLLER